MIGSAAVGALSLFRAAKDLQRQRSNREQLLEELQRRLPSLDDDELAVLVASIPRELDEAAVIDGAGPVRLFFRVIFPLLKSVIVTIVLVESVNIFNDFTNPLYFLPGEQNATVQLTIYNFAGQFTSQYNLLFMDILLITIPPLILYIFFNRQIVAGMTSGAVKG